MLERIKNLADEALWNPTVDKSTAITHRLLRLLRLPYALARDMASGALRLRAMSLVYTTMLSIVPLLALSFSVLKGLGVHKKLEPLLFKFFEPLGERGAEMTEQVIGFVDNVKGSVLGSVGLLFLVWIAFSMVQKVEDSFNYVWQVEKPRSLARRFSEYISVILIGPVVMVFALGMIASINNTALVQKLAEIEPFGTTLIMVGNLAPYLLIVLLFSFVYAFVPNTSVKIRAALGGGAIAGVLWAFTGELFASFVANTGSRAAIYSGFAIVLVALIWLYLSWLILLLGAQISFYIQRPEYKRHGRQQIEPVGQLREGLALTVMINVAQSFRDNASQWSVNSLASKLDIPATALGPVVNRLLASGMLAITEHEKLLPGSEISRIRIADILLAIRENRDIPMLKWEPKVSALTTRVNSAVSGATGDTTLADVLD
ncbi:MAG: YihY/virulence factor BrkB family protein [Gammaproteobacteria bacterium]|nr:YihY/virulence factor BrkB family protein [Gammaproteobacteria bacterium]